MPLVTLNQHIEIFENFAKRHKAIKSFRFGEKPEFGADAAIQYPLMSVYLQPSNYDKLGQVIRSFVVDFSDRLNKDQTNQSNVLSDTERLCFDLMEYLQQIEDASLSFIFTGNSELTDYIDSTDDETAGWFFTVNTKSHIGSDSCNLPISNGTIFDGNYIYIGGSYNGSCSPVLIKDQDGNIVETVQPGGVYTIMVLTRSEERFNIASLPNEQISLGNTPQFIYGVFLNGQKLLPENYSVVGQTITIIVDYGGEIDIIYEY